MKKFAVILSLVLLVGLLAACGSSNNGNSSNSGNSSSNAGSTNSGGNAANAAADDQTAAATNDTAAANESVATERTVKHDKGESVVPAEPKRVVVLSDLGFEDNLLSMGVVPVGAPSYEGVGFAPYLADQLTAAKGIDPYNPNLQEIATLSPDLIICSDMYDQAYEQLNKIAPTVLLAYNPDWRAVHVKLGEVVGKQKEAEEALQKYDAAAADLKAKITAKLGKESVAYLMLSEKMIRAQGGTGHALNDLLYKELGLAMPAGIPADKDRVDLSLEGLSSFNPDNMLLVEYQKVDAVKNSSVWKGMKAVKDNKVFTADGSWMSMSWGPTGRALVLQQLADAIKA